jgi:hypothetical protein
VVSLTPEERAAYVKRALAAAKEQGKECPTDAQLEAVARIVAAHLREQALQ